MIIIDYKDRRPLYEQIVERIGDLIVKGVLEPESKLPSVRNLAVELSINPNTIQRAYGEMERLGYIYTIKGRGNFVAAKEGVIQSKKKEICSSVGMLVEKAKYLGIPEEEFVSAVRDKFREVSDD